MLNAAPPFTVKDTAFEFSEQVPETANVVELFPGLMKEPVIGDVIAKTGAVLSTTKEFEVSALIWFEALSDHAAAPTVIVGEPSPLQLEIVTTAVVVFITFTVLVQVAPPPFNVIAELMVDGFKPFPFVSVKVSVKLFVIPEFTDAILGLEMVSTGTTVSTPNRFLAIAV